MEEHYDEFAKKYDLPSFEEMESNFEISSMSDEEDFGRALLKKIQSHIDFYVSLLEDFIQPDATLGTMREASVLSSSDMILINQLYSKFMYRSRSVLLLNIDYSEHESMVFVKDFYSDWVILKKDIYDVVERVRKVWNGNVKVKEDRGYFG